jgi:hypothetical protein
MDDEEAVVTTEELATVTEDARLAGQYLTLDEITATEMHFIIYELED